MTLCRRAFGLTREVEEQPLRGQVHAGLALYAVTAKVVQRTLTASQAELVLSTTESIEAV